MGLSSPLYYAGTCNTGCYAGAACPFPGGPVATGAGLGFAGSSESLAGLIIAGSLTTFTSPLKVVMVRNRASWESLASEGRSR